MTNEKRFIYEEDIIVSSNNNKSFIVNFGDECKVRVKSSDVIDVMGSEIPEIIAVLIAIIKEKYQDTQTRTRRISKLTDAQVNKTLRELLEEGDIAEDLIQLFMKMKWHDILRIFNSDDPKFELEQVKDQY